MYIKYSTAEEKKQALFEKLYAKKSYNGLITDALREIGENTRARHIDDCATYVKVATKENDVKIVDANFCRQRLCNVCAWRRQAKYYSQMLEVEKVMRDSGIAADRFYFTTLTIKNCYAKDLRITIKKLLSAWDKLLHYKIIQGCIDGYVRAIEVTYNKERKDYHPHVHVVFCLKQGEEPPKAGQLSYYWGKALKVDYLPVIDIRKCTDGTNKDVLKYSLKYRYEDVNAVTVSTYLYSLMGRRLISFGGIYAEIRRALKQGDFEEELNDENVEVEGESRNIVIEHYLMNTTSGLYELIRE